MSDIYKDLREMMDLGKFSYEFSHIFEMEGIPKIILYDWKLQQKESWGSSS